MWEQIPQTLEKLGKWIQDNQPTAAEWPEINEVGYVAAQSLLFQSLDNQGDVLCCLMPNTRYDIDTTNASLKRLGKGVRPDPLPMIEHKVCLTDVTWSQRIQAQTEDSSIDQRYEFERVNWAIRLFCSELLPLGIQRIKLPLEPQQRDSAVHQMH